MYLDIFTLLTIGIAELTEAKFESILIKKCSVFDFPLLLNY